MTTRIRGIGALDRLAEELAAAAGLRSAWRTRRPSWSLPTGCATGTPSDHVHRARRRTTPTGCDDGYDHRALQICAWDDEGWWARCGWCCRCRGKLLPAEEAFWSRSSPRARSSTSGRRSWRRAGRRSARSAWRTACSPRPGSRRARGATGDGRPRVVAARRSATARSGSTSRSSAATADDRNAIRVDPSLG